MWEMQETRDVDDAAVFVMSRNILRHYLFSSTTAVKVVGRRAETEFPLSGKQPLAVTLTLRLGRLTTRGIRKDYRHVVSRG